MDSKKLYEDLIETARDLAINEMWDDSINCYLEAFSKYENEIIIGDFLDLALVYLEVNNETKAYCIIKDVIDNYPDFFIGHHYLGYYYLKLEDEESALGCFLHSEELGDKTSECYYNIAFVFDNMERYDEAIIYYSKVLNNDKNDYASRLNIAIIDQKQGRYEKAIENLLELREYYPQMSYINYNLGVNYGLTGEYEKAKDCYLEELTKVDFCENTYFNLAIIYKDYYRNYQKAKELNLKEVEINKSYRGWYNLGCLHVLTNDFDDAVECFYCAYVLENKILDYLESDEEVISFVNSEYFKMLKVKCIMK